MCPTRADSRVCPTRADRPIIILVGEWRPPHRILWCADTTPLGYVVKERVNSVYVALLPQRAASAELCLARLPTPLPLG